MADINLDSASDPVAAWSDFQDFMPDASDWGALASAHVSTDPAHAPAETEPYPLVWVGAQPELYASSSQVLQHVSLQADSVLIRYWLLRQFREQAMRKNRGIFFIPERDVELLTRISGIPPLQSNGLKGRGFNLLSGLTPPEAARVLVAALPAAERGGNGEYLRESCAFILLLLFKAQAAAGESFSLERVVQLLTSVETLRMLATKAGNSGYSGLSQFLSSFPADPAPRLRAQVGDLVGRLSAFGGHPDLSRWFNTKGDPLVTYLSRTLTAVCLAPDNLSAGLAELQRMWLEFVGVIMARRKVPDAQPLFVCGWPLTEKYTQHILARLLEITRDTGNVFFVGEEGALPTFSALEPQGLKDLTGVRLTKSADSSAEATAAPNLSVISLNVSP